MHFWTVLGRLGMAFLLGAIVGVEREREDKPAGLRTLIIVTSGSALFILVAQSLVSASASTVDVGRIIAGIAQGIGFLGAGTIIVTQRTVHGLTTAAAIWAMSAVGAACGFGMWEIAVAGTLLVYVALRVLGPLATLIGRR